MKKLISILFITTIILTGCQKKDNQINVVLDYTPNTNHIGLYVAEALGYYDAAGLDVNIIQATEVSAETLVSANKAQYGFSYQENVSMGVDNGLDITSIYSVFNHNSSGFISYSEKNITRPKDFENKTYCGWGTDIETAIVKQVTANDGGNPDSVTIKNVSTGFLNTPKSECDIFWEYKGWGTTKADLENISYNYIPITDYKIDYYTPVIITNSKMDEQTNKAFIKATNDGYKYAKEHPKEAADILVKAVPELNYDLVYQSMLTIAPNINDTGYQSDQLWNDFSSWLVKYNILSKNFKYQDAYTNKYLQGE